MKFEVVKKGISLIPFCQADKDKFVKLEQGAVVTVSHDKRRNYEFHKKFFVLITLGFDNQERFKSFEHYRANVLCNIGHCETIFLSDGRMAMIPKSISFDAIPDNNEFETIYSKAVEFIANELFITKEELAEEILSNF